MSAPDSQNAKVVNTAHCVNVDAIRDENTFLAHGDSKMYVVDARFWEAERPGSESADAHTASTTSYCYLAT